MKFELPEDHPLLQVRFDSWRIAVHKICQKTQSFRVWMIHDPFYQPLQKVAGIWMISSCGKAEAKPNLGIDAGTSLVSFGIN